MFNKNGVSAWIAKSEGKKVEWKLNGFDWEELTDEEFVNWSNYNFVSEDSGYFFRIFEDNKMLGNYKIRVNNEAESKEAQELFFELGYENNINMIDGISAIYAYQDGSMAWTGSLQHEWFVDNKNRELTIPQLRDMVVLHRNDVRDATYKNTKNVLGFLCSDGAEYFWSHSGKKWFKPETMTFECEKMEPIQSKLEQGLISGADALRALADGKEVERKLGIGWCDDVKKLSAETILHGVSELRIKPRTIKLSLDIPAPFEPKDGEIFWFVSPYTYKGYDSKYFVDDCTGFLLNGVWRTEEEIKQVVEALRGALK